MNQEEVLVIESRVVAYQLLIDRLKTWNSQIGYLFTKQLKDRSIVFFYGF